MAIIEQGNLSVSNALFGDKTFNARKVKVADFNVETVTDEWTENKEYEITPSTGYDLIDKANITVNVIKSYTITTTISHGTATGDTSVVEGSTAQVTLTASANYALPFSITIANASYTYDYTTGVIVISDMTDNVTITAECIDISSYPSKGDIIKMDLDGNGTDETYLVLKITGAAVEILARETPTNGKLAWDTTDSQVYATSQIDSFLNTTYYATLSNVAKSAIIEKSFTQAFWKTYSHTSSTFYTGVDIRNNTYKLSYYSSYSTTLNRNIYAISVQDIIDYLNVTPSMTVENTTLTNNNLEAMFNITRETEKNYNIGLRDGSANITNAEMNVYFSDIDYGGAIGTLTVNYWVETRPAMQIDLSKITWTPEV